MSIIASTKDEPVWAKEEGRVLVAPAPASVLAPPPDRLRTDVGLRSLRQLMPNVNCVMACRANGLAHENRMPTRFAVIVVMS